MGAKIAMLSDLDTAFPRSDSEHGVLLFDNGYACGFNTNYGRKEFEESWIGKEIKLFYSGWSRGARKSTLKSVRWLP